VGSQSRVEVVVTTGTSAASHKADEGCLYMMFDAADPDGAKLYFTQAEWDAFILGVKDGEFDSSKDRQPVSPPGAAGLDPVPEGAGAHAADGARRP
jgi:hypothetical protein